MGIVMDENRTATETVATTDETVIREWAEENDLEPAYRLDTDETHILDLVHAEEDHENVEPIAWDEFFETMDEYDLAVRHEEGAMGTPRFELVDRGMVDEDVTADELAPQRGVELREGGEWEAVTDRILESRIYESGLEVGETFESEIFETRVIQTEIVETDTIRSEVIDSEVVSARDVESEVLERECSNCSIVGDTRLEADLRERSQVTTEVIERKQVESKVVASEVTEADTVDADTVDREMVDDETETIEPEDLPERDAIEQAILESDIIDSEILETERFESEILEGEPIVSEIYERKLIESEVEEDRHVEADITDSEIVGTEITGSQLIESQLIESTEVEEMDTGMAAGTVTEEAAIEEAEADEMEGEMLEEEAEMGAMEDETTAPTEERVDVDDIHADALGFDDWNLNDEYIVFKNDGAEPLEMGGWYVENEAGNSYSFPEGFILGPDETVTLHSGDGADTDSDLYWGAEEAIWDNDEDTITVFDSSGGTVVAKSYSG